MISGSIRVHRGLFSCRSVLFPFTNAGISVFVGGASFYGDSYIHLRTAEASEQTSLHVHFRTSSQAGLLFLAVGSRDFLLLELTSGHMQVKTPIR